jgi:hypothetical protein
MNLSNWSKSTPVKVKRIGAILQVAFAALSANEMFSQNNQTVASILGTLALLIPHIIDILFTDEIPSPTSSTSDAIVQPQETISKAA